MRIEGISTFENKKCSDKSASRNRHYYLNDVQLMWGWCGMKSCEADKSEVKWGNEREGRE